MVESDFLLVSFIVWNLILTFKKMFINNAGNEP